MRLLHPRMPKTCPRRVPKRPRGLIRTNPVLMRPHSTTPPTRLRAKLFLVVPHSSAPRTQLPRGMLKMSRIAPRRFLRGGQLHRSPTRNGVVGQAHRRPAGVRGRAGSRFYCPIFVVISLTSHHAPWSIFLRYTQHGSNSPLWAESTQEECVSTPLALTLPPIPTQSVQYKFKLCGTRLNSLN